MSHIWREIPNEFTFFVFNHPKYEGTYEELKMIEYARENHVKKNDTIHLKQAP